jgi:hypothetical protein
MSPVRLGLSREQRPSSPAVPLGATGKTKHRDLEDRHMNNRATQVFLFLSGLLLLGIGGAILLVPHAFHEGNGIALGDDPSLLSEIRAPGGLLTAGAVLILLGAFRRSLRSPAMALTVLIYSSFGLARLLSLVLDGTPSSALVGSAAIELIVAAIGLLFLWRGGAAPARSCLLPVGPRGLPCPPLEGPIQRTLLGETTADLNARPKAP